MFTALRKTAPGDVADACRRTALISRKYAPIIDIAGAIQPSLTSDSVPDASPDSALPRDVTRPLSMVIPQSSIEGRDSQQAALQQHDLLQGGELGQG